MTTDLKTLMSERCKWRVSDFEKAQEEAQKRSLDIIFSSFQFHEPTKFVYSAVGVVTIRKRARIRVEWNYSGEAFVGGERDPEFDLKLQ